MHFRRLATPIPILSTLLALARAWLHHGAVTTPHDLDHRAPHSSWPAHPTPTSRLRLLALAVAAACGCSEPGSAADADAGPDADPDAADTGPDADPDVADADPDVADTDPDAVADAELDADADADRDADGDAAPPIGPVIVLHLTDVHIGAQDMSSPAFELALGEIVGAVAPSMTVVTGDLVDEGYDEDLWLEYEALAAVASWDAVAEVPGNHDTHDDYDLEGYLAHSIAGRAIGATAYQRAIEAAGRRVRIVGTNTASNDDRLTNLTGYLDASQVDALIEEIAADPEPVDAAVILGHHPKDGLNGLDLWGTSDELERLISASGAWCYLFGHVHLAAMGWYEDTLMVQGPTLGNPSFIARAGYTLVALDDEGPVARSVDLEVDGASVAAPWPQVLITIPADPELAGDNPHAAPRPRGATGQLLRAAAFSPTPPEAVSFRVDRGPWQPMTAVDRWWEATYDTTMGGNMRLEVQAVSAEGAATAEVTIALE